MIQSLRRVHIVLVVLEDGTGDFKSAAQDVGPGVSFAAERRGAQGFRNPEDHFRTRPGHLHHRVQCGYTVQMWKCAVIWIALIHLCLCVHFRVWSAVWSRPAWRCHRRMIKPCSFCTIYGNRATNCRKSKNRFGFDALFLFSAFDNIYRLCPESPSIPLKEISGQF